MNSLEFINLEIAKAKSDYKKFINFGQTNFAIATEKRIKHLQQIKSELEAWYSIKQGIIIFEDKIDEDSYYEYLHFYEELFDESESEEAGERLIPIKKALEVENECNE